jgi:hypothetical protein
LQCDILSGGGLAPSRGCAMRTSGKAASVPTRPLPDPRSVTTDRPGAGTPRQCENRLGSRIAQSRKTKTS